jgi:hemolysin D
MSLADVSTAVTGLLRRGVSQFDRNDEREFLPAALEVLETPPSPAGRAMAMVIGIFFVIATAWAFLGKVDVLATAPGHLLPSGKIKVIQPLDPGVVREIHVQDGQQVRAGQLLIDLDPTAAGADRDRLAQDLAQTELEVARLNALKNMAETGGAPGTLIAPAGAQSDDLEQARGALRAQIAQENAKIAGLDQQISEKHAEEEEVTATIEKLNASLPMLAEKERLHRSLREQGYGTSFALLDAQQQLSEAKRDLVVEAAHKDQVRAAAASLGREKAQASSEFAAGILSDLAKAEEKENELAQDLVKAQQKSSATQMRAPIDGVVEELAVHTVGGVVTPAERLMVIVPDNQQLTVEAQLANRDVGFVHPGQEVQVKVETFNFTRYGLIPGKVISVSRDAVAQADRSAEDAGGAPSVGTSPQLGPPTYTATIGLSRSSMMVDGQEHALIPGMAVTAEVRTGRRTIIDYLLSPLARRSNEALHER